ncbi:MAG: response regulator transcription factor [Gemmatimonadetes bacterium]|nr:response regulator transcription factor [Gemmatimonadota bacterium]
MDVVITPYAAQVSRRLDETLGNAPAILFLTRDNAAAWDAALRAGARALLPLDAHPEEIVAAIRAVAAGLVVLPDDIAEQLLDALPAVTRAADTSDPLSPREAEILGMLAEGLGNKTIAARLGISSHTVKAHISSLFAKLGASSRAEAVAIGARLGRIIL